MTVIHRFLVGRLCRFFYKNVLATNIREHFLRSAHKPYFVIADMRTTSTYECANVSPSRSFSSM